MIIMLTLTALVVGFSILVKKATRWSGLELVGEIGVVLSCLALAGFICAIPISRMDDVSRIEAYKAFQATLDRARAKGDITDMERAAIQTSIASWNVKLAQQRYWNRGIFDIWIADEITELPDIE